MKMGKFKFGAKTVLASLLLLSIPVLAESGGGELFGTAVIGPLPASWFPDISGGVGEPDYECTPETYRILKGFTTQYQINVSGVANDGDPDTYLRCTDFANLQSLSCIAGLGRTINDEPRVVGCRDLQGPHVLPRPGDVAYLRLVVEYPDEINNPDGTVVPETSCEIFIGTGDAYGEANPNCRGADTGTGGTAGTGGSSGTGGAAATGGTTGAGFACDASNSTPWVNAADSYGNADASVGQCYSIDRANTNYRLHIGTYEFVGDSVTIEFGDSTGATFTHVANQGEGYILGPDVAVGDVYFHFTDVSRADIPLQIQSYWTN